MPYDSKTISEKLAKVLADEFEVPQETLTPQAPLMATLQLDSLDLVDLVVLIEKEFGVRLQKNDFKTINTFAELVEFIMNKSNM
ncbi:MAG: acyl carrier protein [Bacteroidales bacterium]|jgi:acyl carrier protein|nr:acyl carrier protein [Bacteroidales bacterium]